ncbi:tape measure protein [Pararhizobium gei]|uniref:tape measure protein n=1 Tax=Pararhizobium gei TaxID=1395951 RepID=UPI0023DA024A|nr:tape measure protein [Rhizobium gei]
MGKDIDVVIKARDKASKQIDDVAKAIRKYKVEQDELAKGAGKTSAALGGLTDDVTKFQREVDRLKSVGKIAAELDKASAAVTRMEKSVADSTDEVQKLTKRSDEAAAAANRLKAALAAEEAALAANKASLKDNNAQQQIANKLVRDAEVAQERYNKALFTQGRGKNRVSIHTVPTAEQATEGAGIASALVSAKTIQAQVNAEVAKYETVVKESTAAVKELKPQVSEAGSLQRSLAHETERATAALAEERETTARASAALTDMKVGADNASKALGTVGLTQEQVSATAIRMAANLAAAKARIDALASSNTATAGPRTTSAGLPIDTKTIEGQRRAMLEARKEWVTSQAAVKTLAQEIKAADAPTEELGAEFGRAQARARQASDAYEAQRAALQKLQGSSKSTFLAFSQGATAMRAGASSMAAANSQIASSAANASNAQRQLAPAVRGTGQAAGSAAGQTNAFNTSLLTMASNSRQSLSLIQRLRGEVLSLTASYIGFQAVIGQVGGAIDAYKTLEAVQSRLGSVFQQDTAKVAIEIGFLREQADRLGVSFATLGEEYGKFAVAAKASDFATGETREVFLSIAEAARVNKLSTEQTSRVFLAFTQMLNKGKIQSQEVVQQLGEAFPGALKLFSDALGKSTSEFLKLMEAGEVFSTRDNFLKVARQMTSIYGSQLPAALDTATTDLGRFENNIFSANLTIANGLVPGLRLALQSFDEFSKSIEGQETFTNLGVLIGKFLQILAEVPEYFDEMTFAAKLFAAIKLGEIFVGIGARRSHQSADGRFQSSGHAHRANDAGSRAVTNGSCPWPWSGIWGSRHLSPRSACIHQSDGSCSCRRRGPGEQHRFAAHGAPERRHARPWLPGSVRWYPRHHRHGHHVRRWQLAPERRSGHEGADRA